MAMVPQHMLDFGKNEVDRCFLRRVVTRSFVRINGESGVDEMLVSMPHQAGASIFVVSPRLFHRRRSTGSVRRRSRPSTRRSGSAGPSRSPAPSTPARAILAEPALGATRAR